ncbi:hypothetical protein E4Z66_02625 [Aliishimia ponticola]|uniref:Uncharacterized protein n=1 Tax=Aliishimia ponticola TaxID=2499833 RepID=A0A4V3XKV5_9RHOB|nr:hypothetical protein [Aliishimia ponticola]THH38483.1 hypothetical protein E4Z66_02625 [Aliishimia ponticola]
MPTVRLTAIASLLALPVIASDPSAAMTEYVRQSVMTWMSNPEIVNAVVARNVATSGLSDEEVVALDNQWRAEIGAPSSPLIDMIMGSAASDAIRSQVENTDGMITEVFVMDARGLNVAASGVTSDFWQGDEAKFQETHGVGAGAIHVDEISFDESTQTYQGEVSFTLIDPATGAPIGAVTVGLNVEAFF